MNPNIGPLSKGFPKKYKQNQLEKEAWKWYSIFIRLREADWRGYVRCVTCGRVLYWRLGDAGHFRAGRHSSILFDPRNCHFQCQKCNRELKGNPEKYGPFMLKRYGQEVIDELDRLDRTIIVFSPKQLKEMIHLYKSKANQLLKKHG